MFRPSEEPGAEVLQGRDPVQRPLDAVRSEGFQPADFLASSAAAARHSLPASADVRDARYPLPATGGHGRLEIGDSRIGLAGLRHLAAVFIRPTRRSEGNPLVPGPVPGRRPHHMIYLADQRSGCRGLVGDRTASEKGRKANEKGESSCPENSVHAVVHEYLSRKLHAGTTRVSVVDTRNRADLRNRPTQCAAPVLTDGGRSHYPVSTIPAGPCRSWHQPVR